MKLLISSMFFFSSLFLKAQEIPFTIIGNIKGNETFKYAYCFNSQYQLIAIEKINNGSFEIHSKYNTNNPNIKRFGSLPNISIYLSNLDKWPTDTRFSRRKQYQCTVFLSDTIKVLYDSDKKLFSLGNSSENLLQNHFEGIYSDYRNKRDSIYQLIDQMISPDDKKREQKIFEERQLFFKAVKEIAKLCEDNPDSEVSIFNFSPVIYEQQMPGDSVLKYYDKFSSRIKNSVYGKYTFKDVEDKLKTEAIMANPTITVGMKMPTFILPNENGEQITTTSKLGQYTLIDFWASWCVPCRKESPNLINAFKQYQKDGFKVITVSLDEKKEKAAWLKAIKTDGMDSLTNLLNDDLTSDIVRVLKIAAIPQNYLLDKDGTVISVNLRGEMLNEKLKSLFGK